MRLAFQASALAVCPMGHVFQCLTVPQGSSGHLQVRLIFISPSSLPEVLSIYYFGYVFLRSILIVLDACLFFFFFQWWPGRIFYNYAFHPPLSTRWVNICSIDYMVTILAIFYLNKNLIYCVSSLPRVGQMCRGDNKIVTWIVHTYLKGHWGLERKSII